MRPITVTLATGLALLAWAAPASAATYCVSDPACPDGGVTQPDVGAAVAAARTSADDDLVRVGPGRFELGGTATLVRGDALQGAGAGQTTLVGGVELAGSAALRDLEVELTPLQSIGVSSQGGTTSGVAIEGPAGTAGTASGFAGDSRSTFTDGTITMAAGSGAYGSGVGSPTVSDSTITAPVGARASYYGIDLVRTRIIANTGVLSRDGNVRLDAVLIDLTGANARGVAVGPGETTPLPSTLRHVTIRANGAGSTGVSVSAGCSGERASLTVDQTVVTGAATALNRTAKCTQAGGDPAQANLTVTRSAFDPSKVVSTGAGTASIEAPVTPAPALDADGVPIAGSPLIDAGDPAEAAATDIRGLLRPADGDGDGTAVSDIGAFEVQSSPVDPDPTPTPTPDGGIGDPATDTGGTDPAPPADGGVAGAVDQRRTPARPRVSVARVKGQPRRFVVTVRVSAPKGASTRGGKVALDVWARKRNLGVRRATVDKRGRATFVIELRKGVKRADVGIRATFGGTASLTRRASGWSGLS